MPLLAVIPENGLHQARAAALASDLGLPLAGDETWQMLLVAGEKLSLVRPDTKELPVTVDFSDPAHTHRRLAGGGRNQPVAKAIGLGKGFVPTVIDATAGLGNDSFVLACLGCQVTMLERSPVLAALLSDGLARAAADVGIAGIAGRMRLIHADSAVFLAAMPAPAADVIYLDPMYPLREKSSQVKKEMRVLRQLVGDDPDTAALLAVALSRAGRRVVVKRPRHAPAIDGPPPSFTLAGKSSRFDIYLTPRPPFPPPG